VFSLVSSLPSADSAGSGTLPLFAGFPGTMELSDSPATEKEKGLGVFSKVGPSMATDDPALVCHAPLCSEL